MPLRKEIFMNNNGMKFDPMTGEPLNNPQTDNQSLNAIPSMPVMPEMPQSNSNITTPVQSQDINNQPLIQGVPTVEQSQQEFISSTQNISSEKKEEKKDKLNYTFVIVLFVLVMLAIYFLFPILLRYT